MSDSKPYYYREEMKKTMAVEYGFRVYFCCNCFDHTKFPGLHKRVCWSDTNE